MSAAVKFCPGCGQAVDGFVVQLRPANPKRQWTVAPNRRPYHVDCLDCEKLFTVRLTLWDVKKASNV
jgi:hypothetical protein